MGQKTTDCPSKDAHNRKDQPTRTDGDRAASAGGSRQTRRSVLKFAGLLGASTVGTPVMTGRVRAGIDRSDTDGYDIWTVSGTEVYDLSDGEVLENVLVDQTADGASLTIRSQNKSGWEVRNVGFLGTGNNDSYPFQFQVSTPSGDTGLIENVWLNGKDNSGGAGTKMGGIFIRSAHGGHIDIRHTYIEGFGNNAVYGSNCHTDDGGNGGTVAIENAFHRDNTVSQFRLGTDGSVVRNSVGIVHDPDLDRGEYPGAGRFTARGMWGRWDGEVTIENCSMHIDSDDSHRSYAFETSQGATLNVVDCDVNSDAPTVIDECDDCTVVIDNLGESPTVDVIQDGGVPLSAEMAARGQRDMPFPSEMPGGDTTNQKTLTIDGSDADDSTYSLTVTGDLEGTDSLGNGDTIDGSSAEGSVSGGTDEYLFTDELDIFEQDGNATILIDGEVIDPDSYNET